MLKDFEISPPDECAQLLQDVNCHQKMIHWYPWQRTRNTLSLLLAATVKEQTAAEVPSEKRLLASLMHSTIENLKHHCTAGMHCIDRQIAEPDLVQLIYVSSLRTEAEAEQICNSQFKSARIKNVSNEVSNLVKLFGRIQHAE